MRFLATCKLEMMQVALLTSLMTLTSSHCRADDELRPVKLTSQISHVQPMTGIVLWDDSDHLESMQDAIALEYSYLKYSDVVSKMGRYNWSVVDSKLSAIAARGHQAIFRFYDTYVGQKTAIPQYIKELSDYRETSGKSEAEPTDFPDWSNPELRRFILEFYTLFADRYDNDPRLAFIETGFGLWAEYHIYDGPFELGKTFPSKEFQAQFLKHMAQEFETTPWMISVDAIDDNYSPIAVSKGLLELQFGVFDDSFLAKEHAQVNEKNWDAMRRDRWITSPAGGEFSYYTKRDQRLALAENGPYGESFETAASRFHISFMIGADQPKFQKTASIKASSMCCGYRFRVTKFMSNGSRSEVTVTNEGIAPIYYDAYFSLGDAQASESLKNLLPGESIVCHLSGGNSDAGPIIRCDRLVPGRAIQFAADLQ